MPKIPYKELIQLEMMERKYECGGQGYSYVDRIGMLKHHDLTGEEVEHLKRAARELRVEYENIPEIEPPEKEEEEEDDYN